MVNDLNWGADINDFPSGFWDSFDGIVETIKYEDGQYGVQIYVELRPVEYEYTNRGLILEPDSPAPIRGWYSLGNTEGWGVSDDEMDVVNGKMPNRNARATKFMMALRQHAGVALTGSNLSPLKGATAHFKAVTEQNRRPDGEMGNARQCFYPDAPVVGDQGSTIDSKTQTDAEDLINLLLTQQEDNSIRIRQIAQLAIDHTDEFGADAVEHASNPDTVAGMVRSGALVQIDERTVALP